MKNAIGNNTYARVNVPTAVVMRALSSGMWLRVVWEKYTNISEQHTAATFSVEEYVEQADCDWLSVI
jgi:hypothetical protein